MMTKKKKALVQDIKIMDFSVGGGGNISVSEHGIFSDVQGTLIDRTVFDVPVNFKDGDVLTIEIGSEPKSKDRFESVIYAEEQQTGHTLPEFHVPQPYDSKNHFSDSGTATRFVAGLTGQFRQFVEVAREASGQVDALRFALKDFPKSSAKERYDRRYQRRGKRKS